MAAEDADLVLGSHVRGRRQHGSLAPHQMAGNRLIATTLNRRFGLTLTDISPLRAIRADLLHTLDLREMTYGWPTEMIRNTARSGGRIVEVPVDSRRRAPGASKVSGDLRTSLEAGRQMLRVVTR
ncbi:MAG: hypothetical protein ACRDP6_17795 [Actinoallomurus sp.]